MDGSDHARWRDGGSDGNVRLSQVRPPAPAFAHVLAALLDVLFRLLATHVEPSRDVLGRLRQDACVVLVILDMRRWMGNVGKGVIRPLLVTAAADSSALVTTRIGLFFPRFGQPFPV